MPKKPSSEQLPKDYRKDEVQNLFEVMVAGESLSIVGVGSGGKSNLLRLLDREDVQEFHLGQPREAVANFLMLYLDAHKMIFLQGQPKEQVGDSWAGYELILNTLRRKIHLISTRPYFADIIHEDQKDLHILDEIQADYEAILDPNPLRAQTGIRHVENAVTDILDLGERWKVVFLFDEVEESFRLPARFFQSLRGLRDDFKQRVLFVTTSRVPLDDLVDQDGQKDPEYPLDMEGFVELFYERVHYIRPLDRQSAEYAIARFCKRYRKSLTEYQREQLVEQLLDLTGGHVGLMRRCFHRAADAVAGNSKLSSDDLLRDGGVQRECKTILGSLSESEFSVLRKIAHGDLASITDTEAWLSLSRKHLIARKDDPVQIIRIPILARFIAKKYPPEAVEKEA